MSDWKTYCSQCCDHHEGPCPIVMPDEVKQVRDAMIESAEEAGMPASRVYCYFSKDEGAWRVSDNWDHEGAIVFLTSNRVDGVWIRRVDCHDRPMKGGFAEALETANIFFTG